MDRSEQVQEGFLGVGGLSQWPLGFPQDTGPPLALPTPFWLLQMCPSYSTLFSRPIRGRTRASSAAASSPSRFQDSLQGRGANVSGRRAVRVETGGRWGGLGATGIGECHGVLRAPPEDFTRHRRLLPTSQPHSRAGHPSEPRQLRSWLS